MEGRGADAAESEHRVGRRRSTTRDHITTSRSTCSPRRGFDEVSVDDVAARRGYRPAHAVPLLPVQERDAVGRLRRAPRAHARPAGRTRSEVPIGEALRTALLAFNTFDDTETARHRQRMRVILETAELQAYSMTMYAGWRAVVAAFVARRLGVTAATWSRRPWHGPCSARLCRPTSTGWPTRRYRLRAGAGRRVRHGQRRPASGRVGTRHP